MTAQRATILSCGWTRPGATGALYISRYLVRTMGNERPKRPSPFFTNCKQRSIGPQLDPSTLPLLISGKARQRKIVTMFVKITAKRQVTFPARVLEALGVKPGDRIEIEEGPDGFVLRARHIDRSRLAPLRGKLRRGKGTFDLEAFRNTPHERTLRD